MSLLNLFKKKELPPMPSVNDDTEINPPEEKRAPYVQVRFPDGIVIAEEPILVLPQLIDDENRYPALIYDCEQIIPPTIIGSPEPIAGNDMDFEYELTRKASKLDIRIAVALNNELPNIDENGNKILDRDWHDSIRLYIHSIVGTEEYKKPRNENALPKIYYISNEDIQRQIAANEG